MTSRVRQLEAALLPRSDGMLRPLRLQQEAQAVLRRGDHELTLSPSKDDAPPESLERLPERACVCDGGSCRSGPTDQLQSLTEDKLMTKLTGLASIVSELRAERTNLANQLKHVDAALSVIGKLGGGSVSAKPGRTVSASARRKISLAQKARWARARNVVSIASKRGKRTISAAGKKRIAAAQRARWAKIRAAKMLA